MFTPKLATDVIPRDDLLVDWEHVYLLGWTDREGHQYLTTWRDDPDSLHIQVVVTGPLLPCGPPMWDAPAPLKDAYWRPSLLPCQEFTLHLVGPGEEARDKARYLGGVSAIGWYIRDGFQRGWHQEGCQKTHPLGATPCWGTTPEEGGA